MENMPTIRPIKVSQYVLTC